MGHLNRGKIKLKYMNSDDEVELKRKELSQSV